MLLHYIALGTKFLSDHQRKAGNFDYEYDWSTGINVDDDMEVRQAGALWGMTLIFHDMMDAAETEGILQSGGNDVLKATASHVKRGIAFFQSNSKVLKRKDGTQIMRYITYPGATKHSTGTQALVCLALVDFLRALGSSSEAQAAGVTELELEEYRTLLNELLPFLVTQHSWLGDDRFRAWDTLVVGGEWALLSGIWFGERDDDNAMLTWWLDRKDWDGYFHQTYDELGKRSGGASPYYDGESVLAITKAAKYLGPEYVHLWPVAAGTAIGLHQLHVEEQLEEEDDPDDTKGVYQWLSMALFELATVKFGKEGRFDLPAALEDVYNADQFGTWLVDLSVWMVDVHKTLQKSKNTGYAYEGIVPAWAWASHVTQRDGNRKDTRVARKLQCTIENGLDKLMSWQVGMGAEEGAKWDGVKGLGGVQNAEDETGLRIDVTQHQMHATILTRRLVYARTGATWPWEGVVLSAIEDR